MDNSSIEPACRFRGDVSQEIGCVTCKGNTKVKAFWCQKHMQCTVAKQIGPVKPGQYMVCTQCTDRPIINHWVAYVDAVAVDTGA